MSDLTQPEFNDPLIKFNYSKEHLKIISSLLKVQSEMGVALKDSTNPHFKSKYANYRSVWDAVGTVLSQNKILYTVFPSGGPKLFTFDGVLMHASGEYIKASVQIEGIKNGPQEFGSLTTYMKRYLLQLLTGVATDDDDDGNSSQGKGDKQQDKPKPKGNYKPPTEPPKPKSPMEALISKMKEKGIENEDMPEIIFRCLGEAKTSKELTPEDIDLIISYIGFSSR